MTTIIIIVLSILAFFVVIKYWIYKAEFHQDASDRLFDVPKLIDVKCQSGISFDIDGYGTSEGDRININLCTYYSDSSVIDFELELKCIETEVVRQYGYDTPPEVMKPAKYEGIIEDIFCLDEKCQDIEFIQKTLVGYFEKNHNLKIL